MNSNSYANIRNFGPKTQSALNNPLTYCIDNTAGQRFMHGSYANVYGQNSRSCQLFLSEYCAENWDGFCEYASHDVSTSCPDQYQTSLNECGVINSLERSTGEKLIYDTAERKYLIKMHNGIKKYEPFDPTVPTSPMISYWTSSESGSKTIPEYSVNAKTIDNDVVMDKILAKPTIAMNILINIYNTMKRNKTLSTLKNTKLGNFYSTHPYFKNKGGI